MKITISRQQTLFEFLKEQYPDSPRTRIKKLLQSGKIRINNQPETLHSLILREGDIVDIDTYRGPRLKGLLPFSVLYEDQDVMVIDKPPGISTSSIDGSENIYGILNRYLKDQTKGRIKSFVVHRLDKEVSGVLLFAKSESAMETLKGSWKYTEKHYYALVEGIPAEQEGSVKSWLKEDKNYKMASSGQVEGAKFAVTHYKVTKTLGSTSLLDITIDTGRKNQIRVHLSDIGCPIVGDRRYGASAEYKRRIRLHAYSISFDHPVGGQRINVKSPVPPGFLTLKPANEVYK